MFTAITHESLLQAWEQSQPLCPSRRALALLAAVGESATEMPHWPAGRRDRRLFELRRLLFGERVAAGARCTACGAAVALQFGVSELLDAAECDGEWQTLEAAGVSIDWRLPNCGDLIELAELAAHSDAGAADFGAEWLRTRLLTARRGDVPVSADELPADAAAAICAAMAQADPIADVRLAIDCPECKATSEVLFDAGGFLWSELDAWARRELSDVHELARAYGWSQDEVFSLAQVRRQYYLELIGS